MAIKGHDFQTLPVTLLQKRVRLGVTAFPVSVLNKELLSPYILAAVQQDAVRGLAIAAGPAGLLVITFHISGHVVMHDKGDIGFVNAHTKGVCGDHDGLFVKDEQILIFFRTAFGKPA